MDESLEQDLHQITKIGRGFSLEEATSLINHEVIKKIDRHKPRSMENIGLISGLSTKEDEIEITISFLGREDNATKSIFKSNYLKLT